MSLRMTVLKDTASGEFHFSFPAEYTSNGDRWIGINKSDFAYLRACGNYHWELEIDTNSNQIVCKVYHKKDRENTTPRYERRLPLREGMIVLSDLSNFGRTKSGARVSFREPEFQAFLDRYGIDAVRHCSLNGRQLRIMERVFHNGSTATHRMTSFVRTDGDMIVSSDGKKFRFEKATWVLEERVDLDDDGQLIHSGYILYTLVKNQKKLEKSFAENGILDLTK